MLTFQNIQQTILLNLHDLVHEMLNLQNYCFITM